MEILVILLLILLNGLFAMSEIALISARRSNLEMQARQGSAGARQALKLAKDPDRFLSTVQIGITLIGILTGIYSGDTLAAKFGGELARLGIPLRTATVTAQVTIVIAVTYLTIIFGELVPKRIGMNAAERAAKIVAQPMRLLSVAASPFVWLLSRSTATVTAQVTIVIAVTYLTIIFGELVPKRIGMNAAERAAKIVAQPMRLLSVAASPFVWLLSRSTAGVARLLGLQRAESKVTEAEIRSIIQEGAEDGEVQAVEQQIMGRVFSLGDRTVESIMTHRSELAWIDAAASAAQIRETVARAPHNRYPVGEGSLDKLLGVVCLKDLFLHLGDEGFDLRRLVAPAKFFHEGFEVYNALEQLRTEQLGYGIICDEFGVTRGIITLRDIFEALVGELPDPREEPDIVRREDGSCLVDGQCPFYDFLDWFGLENALPCNAYNTVSGLILDQLAHIPATGEKLEWNGFTFEIVDMDGARIDKILVSQKQQP